MRPLFVDTAGWMAMADEADPVHRSAMRMRDKHLEKGGLLFTSDYVMDETLALIREIGDSHRIKPLGEIGDSHRIKPLTYLSFCP